MCPMLKHLMDMYSLRHLEAIDYYTESTGRNS